MRRDQKGASQQTVSTNKPPFDEVVDRYYDKVLNLAFRLMGDREEAHDLAQEVFIHAYQAYDRFRGDSEVFTWLYRITVNLAKNRYKQLQREREHKWEILEETDEEEEEVEPFEWEDTKLSPETLLEQKEIAEAIQRAIDELPEDQRVTLVLRDIEGLSYKEIARIQGCSVEAVKSRLFRARSTLRKKLRPFLER
ncbi:MAG: sigma-70 family RNA polymerase sigma factor [Armatimonadetes bacterium]|nr:sigma-70 family RNA polymerase sigma factor [Armatimonadota bacterium]MDW8026876.1 sigma-70 family RNA polymerase sigma factor [Armatimonadota bacterium]